MSLYVESNIEFDFTAALRVLEHDKALDPANPLRQGNTTWPGVDFCLEEVSGWIWLELKNWDPAHVDPRRRGRDRWSFICKMKSDTFAKDMRNKFLGTTAFLAWTNAFPLAPIRFIMLFEPPYPMDSALLGSRTLRMRDHIPNRRIWQQPVHVSVLTLREWKLRFPHYPARLL